MSDRAREKRFRVLFLTRKWPPAVGGMETYSRELATDLAPLVNLTVRALPGCSDGRPPSLLLLANFVLCSAIFLYWHKHDYDVVHLGDFALFPLAWWHALWAPQAVRLITVHGLDLLYANRAGFKPALYRLFVGWAQKRRRAVNHFIANSRHTAILCENAGFSPVGVVTLGVRPKTNMDSSMSDCLPNERYVLFVGRLVHRKGAKWFAENVLPQLPEDVKFYVVGKTWDLGEKQGISDNPRVCILGYLPDEQLRLVQRKACAIVMPNIKSEDSTDVEGFGLVALEAAMSGVPLVASDIEGIRDAVRHEETGFLVQAENVQAWVSQLSTILEWGLPVRRRFGDTAVESLKRYFSWSRVARETAELYRRCLLNKREESPSCFSSFEKTNAV